LHSNRLNKTWHYHRWTKYTTKVTVITANYIGTVSIAKCIGIVSVLLKQCTQNITVLKIILLKTS